MKLLIKPLSYIVLVFNVATTLPVPGCSNENPISHDITWRRWIIRLLFILAKQKLLVSAFKTALAAKD